MAKGRYWRNVACLALCLMTVSSSRSLAGLAGDMLPAKAPSVSLRELAAVAFQSNPMIRAARHKWESAIERYPQARALPDPMLAYGYSVEPIETRLGPQRHRLSLSQSVPFPGKLKLKGDIASREAQIAHLEFEKAVRDVIVALKISYFELLYIDRAIEITRQNKTVMDHLVEIGTADYAQDVTTLNDVLKAQAQLAQLSYDFVLLEELRQTEVTRVNTLLNRDPETPIGELLDEPLPPITFPIDKLYALARDRQEEVRISDLQIEKSLKAMDLADKVSLPDFSLGFSYLDVGESIVAGLPESGKDSYGFSLGISLPIWFGKNSAAKREARLNYLAAREMRDLQLNNTYTNVKNSYFKLTNAERLVTLYKESLIPQAEESLEIAETWYREGKGSFSDLLETQSVWLNFNLAYYRAISDYQQHLARLEGLVGVDLRGLLPD